MVTPIRGGAVKVARLRIYFEIRANTVFSGRLNTGCEGKSFREDSKVCAQSN